MRRRDFLLIVGAVAAWPLMLRARQGDGAHYLRALDRARQDYAKTPHPSEAARAQYLTRLVRLREQAARLDSKEWQAIDAEVKNHPAPVDSDTKALSGLRVGNWESPRHDYLYRADGTWTMLPADPDATRGTWRFDGNRAFETVLLDPPRTSQFTIILLTKTDFVFADGDDVFYEKRAE